MLSDKQRSTTSNINVNIFFQQLPLAPTFISVVLLTLRDFGCQNETCIKKQIPDSSECLAESKILKTQLKWKENTRGTKSNM